MKICRQCKQSKQDTDFYSHKGYKSGRRASCKGCEKVTNKRYYDRNRERLQKEGLDNHYRRNYGLSLEEAIKMKSAGCAVCGGTNGLTIDHDHQTGLVRGCLCYSCNAALGMLKEDTELMRKLITYKENNI